jgi:hypothetical protein
MEGGHRVNPCRAAIHCLEIPQIWLPVRAVRNYSAALPDLVRRGMAQA